MKNKTNNIFLTSHQVRIDMESFLSVLREGTQIKTHA